MNTDHTADPVTAEEADIGPQRDDTPVRSPRRTRMTLGVLATVALASLVFAVVIGIRVFSDRAEANELRDAADAATSAASVAAEQILSYVHGSVEEDLAASQELMTESFAEEYAELEETVANLSRQRELDVVATVRNSAPLECGDECTPTTVRVLLFVDQARTAAGESLDSNGIRAIFTMTEHDGTWLVNDITSL